MKKFEVTDRIINWDLTKDIMKTRPLRAKTVSKWGTGVHEKDFGKIRAFSVTVLYIPIMVGASW
jgi:hypothetical protein